MQLAAECVQQQHAHPTLIRGKVTRMTPGQSPPPPGTYYTTAASAVQVSVN